MQIANPLSLEEQFEEVNLLRHKQNSFVYLCRHVYTGVYVVIEKYHHQSVQPGYNDLMLYLSQQTLNRKVITNIITIQKTLNIIRRPSYTWFICENIEGLSTLEYMKNGPIPLQLGKYIFFLLIKTIQYLHQHELTIRNWEPENFILSDVMIRFIDIDSLQQIEIISESEKGLSWIGDPRWMAPESFMSREYDMGKAAIWCLGLYLYLFITGKPLFSNGIVFHEITHFKFIPPPDIDPLASDLLSKMLVINPKKRSTLFDILDHKFLQPQLPFPVSHFIYEKSEELTSWIEFFGLDINVTLDEMRSSTITDRTMLYYMAVSAAERGIYVVKNGPPKVSTKVPGRFVLPPSIKITNESLKICHPNASSSRSGQNETKKKELRKLIDSCSRFMLTDGKDKLHMDNLINED